MNYQQDINIDPEALDIEWLRQPQLYARYAEESARAKDTLNRAKEALDVVRAELDGAVRGCPENYGIGKVTEAVVAATILQLPEYKASNEAYLSARLSADLIQSAVTAMDHRRSALENLVRLHAASYFAGPREPRNIGEEFRNRVEFRREERADSIREVIREHMTRRRRGADNGE